MPRPKKPPGTAVDKRNGQRAVVGVPDVMAKPELPSGLDLCGEARKQWDLYWESAPASVQTPADRGLVLRWIDSTDRYLKLINEADKEPTVTGSQDQVVANPLYKIAEQALGAVERCEKQMGIGALNRAGLGIAVLTEQRSLADMNARYGGDDVGHEGDDEPDEEPDPRLTIVPGEVV